MLSHALSLAALVNPFVGTASGAPDFGTGGGSGGTFPGVSAPFGMVQLSPDTRPGDDNPQAGYAYRDRRIRGFSLTHFSGGGCTLLQDVPILPVVGSVRRPARAPRFDHRHEHAEPGAYEVTLDPDGPRAIRVRLTATTRAGVLRLRFPRAARANVVVDAGGSAMGADDVHVRVDPHAREIAGSAETGRQCYQPMRYRVFLAARFSRPLRAFGTWRDDTIRPGSRAAGGRGAPVHAGAYASFDARRDRAVDVRVGVSYLSVAGARANLRAEVGHRSFAAVRAAARARWARLLGRVRVDGGRRRDRRTFATALYHALLAPTTFSDADGRYRGMDGRVHRALGFTKLTNVSAWDVYRTQAPLLAMLLPDRARDLARSLLADARESGCLPRWPLAGRQTNIMVGDPSAPILAGAYALGVRGFSARAALRWMVRGATRACHVADGDYTEREGLGDLERLGFLPREPAANVAAHTLRARSTPWGPAATTLEDAVADSATSRLAGALGGRATAAAFARRGARWRNLLNPRTRTIEPRGADGRFAAGVDPASGDGFVEGNAAQYTWMVPQAPRALAGALGGPSAAARRLDRFFTRLNAGPGAPFAYLGNEPGLGTPWLYTWLGRPRRTQAVVRRALLGLYAPTPGGMPGNDDGGTLSAWWLFGALGLYPAVPGTDVLALGSPLFPRATLRLPAGRVVISAPGAARDRPYVRRMRLDGRPVRRPRLRFAQLRRGARLDVALDP